MLPEYKKKTIVFMGTGFILQLLFLFTLKSEVEEVSIIDLILQLAVLGGIILFTMGCWYYAKGKGYHGAYGFLGLIFNIFGLIILIAMPDKHKKTQQDVNRKDTIQ